MATARDVSLRPAATNITERKRKRLTENLHPDTLTIGSHHDFLRSSRVAHHITGGNGVVGENSVTRFRIAMTIALALIISGVSVSAANAAARYNGATRYMQEESNWCWAAASKTVVRYYTGSVYSQCQLVKWGRNTPRGCADTAGNFVTDVTRALNKTDMDSAGSVASSAWPFLSVKSAIDNSNQLMIRWGWDSGGGHALVVRGYNTSGSVLSYFDPLSANWKTASHSWMRDGSTHTWTHTRHGMSG